MNAIRTKGHCAKRHWWPFALQLPFVLDSPQKSDVIIIIINRHQGVPSLQQVARIQCVSKVALKGLI